MDERIKRVVDVLFVDRDEVSHDEAIEAIKHADIDESDKRGMSALVRERYTRQQLVHELEGLVPGAPVGGGAIFGGAG